MPFVYAGLWGPDAFTDSYGNVLVGATLTVYNAGSLTAATLYIDQTKTTVGLNPVSPDTFGNFSFWANPGQYDLVVNYQGQAYQSLKGVLVSVNPAEASGAAVPDGSITGGPAAIGVKLAQTTITHDNVATANKDGLVGVPSLRTLGTGALQAMAGSDTRVVQGAILNPGPLTGATAATRYVGGTVSGAPVAGTFAVGDFVIDQSGTVWICTAAGTPGTWSTPSVSTVSKQQRVALWAVPTAIAGDTWVKSTSGGTQQYPYGQTNAGNVNAAITWPFVAASGTYEIDLFHLAGSSRGIYTIQIDGVTVGTIDGYAAAGAQSVSVLAGIAIAVSGQHTITLLMATKNASSSSFFAVASELILTKTA